MSKIRGLTREDGTAEEYTILQDNNGRILTKEEFLKEYKVILDIFEKAKKFHFDQRFEHWIKRRNFKITYSRNPFTNELVFPQNEKEDFLIPQVNANFKEFKPALKRNWSFKCDWCGIKVSSKTHKGYYTLKFPSIRFDELERKTSERGCSEECASHIWKEVFKNWVNANNYGDIFEL